MGPLVRVLMLAALVACLTGILPETAAAQGTGRPSAVASNAMSNLRRLIPA